MKIGTGGENQGRGSDGRNAEGSGLVGMPNIQADTF